MSLLHQETDFGLQLLQQQNLNESLVFSPLSITLALLLVHVGARGETRDQIRNVLVKNATDEELEQHFTNISASLLASSQKGTKVNIANHVFSRVGYPIKQSYLDTVEKLYNAGATSLNFNDKEATANAINKFVCENTRGLIKDIVQPGSISNDLVAVLINAIYFEAEWQDKFKSSYSEKRDFFSSADLKRNIDFLCAYRVHRNYAENDQFQILSLPYKDNTYSMNIFLPKTRFGLEEALKNLDSATIQHLLSNVSNTYIHVAIPKWKIEKELDLQKALQTVGIKNAFSSSADFGNMAEGVYISKVTHKAFVEVDEDGTKAAAVTKIEYHPLSAAVYRKKPKEFIADHPFLFVLTKDNHPLFIGLHY